MCCPHHSGSCVCGHSLAVNLAHADPADSNDPRVRALATSLGNNPTTIFQYVRDNIGIEVYTGSLRGARGTLASKAGNSHWTAPVC